MARATDGRKGRPGALRRGLMLYGSTAALAAALMLAEGGLGPALAQDIGPRITPNSAAQGDFTVPGPTPAPSFEYRSGSLDIVSMNRDAVLNWTTYDTAPPGGAQGNSYVNFLPAGTELRFVGNGQSFTAINRVFTTPDNAGNYRGIAFQGRVTSYLFGDGPNSVGPVGGNIWFFSPGGILATGSASFNVGSLLLSASDLGNFREQGPGRSVDLTGVADPFASVILRQGALVALAQPGSSFTIVAPTIEQGGDVTVNGSVLYLSAEQGNLNFYNDGQIIASIGREAQAGNEIRHLGTTTGPASIGTDDFSVFDPQTIDFRTGEDVRVLLSGSIGYAAATEAAMTANGSIVLSVGAVSTAGDLTLTSNTSIRALEVELSADAGESLTMGRDANGPFSLDVTAAEGTLAAGAGGLIDVAGDVNFGPPSETGSFRVSAAGAEANNPGGRILVGGDLSLQSTSPNFGATAPRGGEVEATIGDGGSIAVGGDMTLRSDGYAADVDGVTLATGGRAVLTMTGANAGLTVGESLTISAQALPFARNCECFPPGSGSATGGYAALTATGGTIEIGDLGVSASAEAFASSFAEPGAILDASGGTALVNLGDSTARLSSISVEADAFGAGGKAGVEGGSAFGGTASFSKSAGGSLAAQGIVVSADATGGDGNGPDGEGLSASRGGDAEGGTAILALARNPEGLGYLDLSATAQAGDGGDGVEFSAESGGDGGNAIGGDVSLTLSGAGTNLASVREGGIDVWATGGWGGDGEADFGNAVQGGDGGMGGAARGGNLAITAAEGAEFAWDMSFGLFGVGGSGGLGGDQTIGGGGPSGIGRGGRGGDATGAAVAITADGGAIAGDLGIDARGLAGEGGLDGFDRFGTFTGSAESGVATGGSIALTARDNGASRFEVGTATFQASGDIAGLIALTDESTAPGAAMSFGSLSAVADGAPAGATPAIRLSAVRNAVVVDGTAELYGASISLDFTGTGRLETGYALLSTSTGDIAITHADNPGVLSLYAIGGVDIHANGNYLAGVGSVVASGDNLGIRATGSILASDTRGSTDLSISAGGDASIGDASSGGNFELFAGRREEDGAYAYLPSARATITGTVAAGGSVLIESGGFAEFAGGSSVLSDNDITVRTGDDIIVASGASLVSAIDPFDFDSIRLRAGDIDFGPFIGDLIEPIGTPIASLRIAGSLDTNGASLFLSGDAIDATGSSIATGNLTVDVTDAPPFGPFSNDGGLLSAECRQGSACLGSIAATGDVEIGLASNSGLVSLRTGAIDFTGGIFEVETLERLDLNPGNIPSSLTAGNRISLRSVNDAVALTGVTLEAPDLRLTAGTDLAAGSATLIGGDSVRIEVGNDLVAGAISTGGELDDGSETGTFSTPGDFIVGSLAYGSGNAMRIAAGGDLSLGSADPNGGDIELRADGALFLGSTAVTSGAIRLEGNSVGFTNLASSALVYVTAGEGGITGLSGISPVIDAAGGIGLESAGDIDVGDLVAGTDIAIAGAAVSVSSLSAGGALGIVAEGAGSVGTFESGGYTVFSGASFEVGGGYAGSFLAVLATDGDLTFGTLGTADTGLLQASAALSGGDVVVGGALSLLGGSMAIGGAEAGGGIGASIGGDASFTALASGSGPIAIAAGGDIAGGVIDAAMDVDLSGGIVAVANLAAGGNLLVDAFALQATTLSAGGDMTLALEGGAFLGTATAGGDLALGAGNGIAAGSLIAGAALSVISDSPAVIGEAVAGGDLSFTGSALDAGSLDAGTTLDVAAALSASIDSFSSGGDATLSGRSLDLGSGTVGGNLSAQASEGELVFTALTATGDAELSAVGALSGGDATSGGTLTLSGASLAIGTGSGAPGVVATTPGSASFAVLEASEGDVALDAGGAVDGGAVVASNLASVRAGGAVALAGLTAGDAEVRSTGGAVAVVGVAVSGLLDAGGTALTLTAPGALRVDALATAGAIGIVAGGDLRIDATASGDIALASTGGSVFVGGVGQPVDAPGGIGVEAVNGGGAVSVSAANAISVADGLSAGGALTMTAGGLVTLSGPATGQTIALRAGDLAISSGGSLGNAGTQRISLASSAPVNLGGGANSGFAVDRAEFDRIRSGGDLLVTALAGANDGAGSLTVGSLTVNAGSGGQIAAAGTFGLTASGVLDVGGTLSIAGAGSGTSLMLSGDAVDLDYANAALSVLDSGNAPTGRIVVAGRLIASLSASAAADIVGKTPAEIDRRLGLADVVREIGLFRTASLTLEGRDAILIQNSGGAAVDERRGLSVGALTVTGAPDGRTLVVINGIVNNATGNGAAQNVTVTTPIAAGSTVNGCALANIAACAIIPEREPPLILAPDSVLFGTGDFIKNGEDEDDEVEEGVADGTPEAPPIDTSQIDDPAGLPMIDVPVTGAGNEDLWQPPEG